MEQMCVSLGTGAWPLSLHIFLSCLDNMIKLFRRLNISFGRLNVFFCTTYLVRTRYLTSSDNLMSRSDNIISCSYKIIELFQQLNISFGRLNISFAQDNKVVQIT